MTKRKRLPPPALLLPALALLLGVGAAAPAPASAQEAELFAHASHVVVPQRRSFSVRRSAQPIAITKVRARVSILEQAATTTVEVLLANPSDRATEAVLLMPVPDGAAVSAFTFEGAAPEPTARLLPREEARRIYDDIVRKLRDPALLEFAGWNLVRTSVFPVPARGTQRVRLTYEHLLPRDGARVDYLLPRSEALEVDIPWEIEVDLKAKAPIATVYSPSHTLVETHDDARHWRLRVREDGRLQPGPFRLSWLLDSDGLSASLLAYPDPKIGGGYFLLLAGLPPHEAVKRASMRREVTLVIDRSGSMAGGAMDQVKKAAVQIIEGLADGEAFNIIDYSNQAALFSEKPVLRTEASVREARAYLASLRPTGGTNIHDALVEALRQPPREGMLGIVLFLTDGLPTVGQTAETTIRELADKGNPHARRVFTFGVGADVNVPLLDRIAEASRATSTYAVPGEDVELKVAQVFRRLYGPVLADAKLVTVDGAGGITTRRVREPIPAVLPDLFEGDQLVLLGQYVGEEPLEFRLQGQYFGRPREFRFRFELGGATTRNAFVPRLWASRRIAFLVDQIRQAGAPLGDRPNLVGESVLNDPRFRELVDEVLRLSTEFGILSEYTSFLATEGTDLGDWERLNLICNGEIDSRAVKRRSGLDAVAQSRNLKQRKGQAQVDLRNGYLDEKLQRVEIDTVQQVNETCLFKRGDQWIDGRIVATRGRQAGRGDALEADETIEFGSPAWGTLLDELIHDHRQALLARTGDILLEHRGRAILVRNRIDDTE